MTKSPAVSLPSVRSHDRTCLALSVCASALLATSAFAQTTQTVPTPPVPAPAQTTPAQPGNTQATPSQPSPQTAAVPEQPQTADQAGQPGQQETVTIVGQRPAVQKKIDRDVYDIKQDPQAATGSAADVMNNVPSVSVDPDGTVSLRGNTNVQVYVNGKPAAQMQGDNRAATLQSMAADDIDSIEVMTNPSSAFGADSGGGIVNIVLKRNRRLAPAANIGIMYGSEGRGGFNASGSRAVGKFGLSGSLNYRNWVRKDESDTIRTRNPDQPTEQDSFSNSVNSGENNNWSARGQVDYALTDYSNLSAELNLMTGEGTGHSVDETRDFDLAGNLVRHYARVSENEAPRTNASFVLSYDWRSANIDGETFRSQVRLSNSDNERSRDVVTVHHQPSDSNEVQRYYNDSNNVVNGFSGDWVRPLADEAQLTAGWDITQSRNENYNFQSLVDSPGTPNPARTNWFDFERTVSAAYVTYQKTIGQWGVLGGMRVEAVSEESVSRDIDPSTADIESSRDYVDWSPSLYVTYDLGEDRRIRGTYSRKVNRPQGNVLNPFIVYVDPQNVSSGNPDLEPEKVDTFELEYDRGGSDLNYSVEAYYRNTDNAATFGSVYLPGQPDVLWTTTINSGARRESGIEVSLSNNGPRKKFTYSINGEFGYSEQETLDIATGDLIKRSGPKSSARVRLNYKPRDGVNYMFMIRARGESPTSQGYQSGFATANFNYSRDLTQKLRLNIHVNDVFNSETRRSFTETSIVRIERESRQMGPTVMVNLSYRFGGPNNRDNDRQQGRGREGGPGGGFGGGPGGSF